MQAVTNVVVSLVGSMHQTLLAPIDDSDEAFEAARHAVSLAAAFDAVVHVLYVMESKPAYTSVGYSGLQDEMAQERYREHAEEKIERVLDVAEQQGVDYRTEIKGGIPHVKIVKYADEVDADGIVMGARGHGWGGVTDVMLGSTTQRVIRNTSMPVTTVQ